MNMLASSLSLPSATVVAAAAAASRHSHHEVLKRKASVSQTIILISLSNYGEILNDLKDQTGETIIFCSENMFSTHFLV